MLLRFLNSVCRSRAIRVLDSKRTNCIVPSVAAIYLHPLCSRGVESAFPGRFWDRSFSEKHTVTKGAFEAFDAVAAELMVEQKVSASELHERLRNVTKNASKGLPPVEVLYCNSYGGYSYSKAFEDFLETVKTVPDSLATICAMQFGPEQDDFGNFVCYSYKNRVRHVQWLAPFGQDIMDKWPGIVPLVQAYMRNDLGNKMELIQKMLSRKERLDEIVEISQAIGAQIGTIDGKTEYSIYELKAKDDFSAYAPSVLGKMRKEYDAEQSELTVAIKEYSDVLHMHLSETQISAMVKSLDPQENVEKKPQRRDWQTENLSFIERLATYGEHHHVVWEKQRTFNHEAMRFLRLHPEHTEQLASQGDSVDCAKKLGLCAAGSQYCNLEINEVPCRAEWEVGEYDGLESVYLV